MTAKPSLPEALRRIRKARGLSQEAFSNVSSRTYLSSLERGLKSPTLKKLEELCEVLEIHPIALLMFCYFDEIGIENGLHQINKQVKSILQDNQSST